MGAVLGISQNMVSNYENGREPPMETLIAYAQYFDVSVEYLLGLSDDRIKVKQDGDKVMEAMRTAAAEQGQEAFTRGSLLDLAAAFVSYYQKGSPAGSLPMDMTKSFIKGMIHLLDASANKDVPALLTACNELARTGLDASGTLSSLLLGDQNL